jgi:hypothetical protein
MPPVAKDRRRRTTEASTCLEGGNTHCHESTGLDTSTAGQLVNTRRCVWCGRGQEKPYGAGSRQAWRDARPTTRKDSS